MYLFGISILVLVLKYLEVGPFASMSWWWVAAPFALTAAWWTWADYSGYTKRKVMEKEDRRKAERIQKQKEQLGFKTKNRKIK